MDVKRGTIPKTNNFAPENGWLESMKSSFWVERPIFRGELLILGMGTIQNGTVLVTQLTVGFQSTLPGHRSVRRKKRRHWFASGLDSQGQTMKKG